MRVVAVLLSALAGFVDAVGFIASGGFFVSFMSGNSTRLGIGIMTDRHAALLASGLILSFVLGVMLAMLVRGRREGAAWNVLLLVGVALALAAALHRIAPTPWVLPIVALAMGAENVAFAGQGQVVALTYMTGTLVRVGQALATAITGGDRWGWAPLALMWAGLIAGGAMGAWAALSLGLDALWLAAAVVVTAALTVRRLRPA
ncbi:YoaK family protein [Sphingomonas sp.]|uniref:YoaK family protein n=1 Tax=Sphingomonas sp. TaxID=28214 RepID=UPI003F7CF68A